MKFVFFRIFLIFLGLIFLSCFYLQPKMFVQSELQLNAQQDLAVEEEFKINNNNSLFSFIKIIKLLKKSKIDLFKKDKINQIILKPKLINEKEQETEGNPTTVILDLNLFSNFEEENLNCQNNISQSPEKKAINLTKKAKEKCISNKIVEWKNSNTSAWNTLKKINTLYAKMKILTKEIKVIGNQILIPGEIQEESYTEWKKQEPNYPDKELIIQGLILEIVNWDYQGELNEKLKEMKRKKFFETIDAKTNLLLKTKAKKDDSKSKKEARDLIKLVTSLRELKNKKIEEIDIKNLNLDQFLGFWYIKEIGSRENLKKLLSEFTDETTKTKDSRKIKEEKWYIITLAVGGGIMFLLIVNYIFWKLKK